MIKINFEEPNTPEWQGWIVRCNAEQQKHNAAIEEGRSSKVKDYIYKGQKEQIYMKLEGPFHGKCAYCEIKIYQGFFGDVEHYRPKGAVTDENFEPVMIVKDGQTQPHPGYYWRTYDWKNLLPACDLCNKKSTKRSRGRLIGKSDRFPVKNSHATRAEEEKDEEPLLLNPVWDDPSEHLELDDLGAVLLSKKGSEIGNTCIRILGLNDRDLPNDRGKVYKTIADKMGLLAQSLSRRPNGQDTKELLDEIIKLKEGYEEYTIAARKAINDSLKNLGPLFNMLLQN